MKRLSELPVGDGGRLVERYPYSGSHRVSGAFRVGRIYSQPSVRLNRPINTHVPACRQTATTLCDVCFMRRGGGYAVVKGVSSWNDIVCGSCRRHTSREDGVVTAAGYCHPFATEGERTMSGTIVRMKWSWLGAPLPS